jgi:hypothetical protein
VAPRSIVELSRDEERRRSNAADIMEALKPINDKDSREGRKDWSRKIRDLVSENESEDSEDGARDAIEFEILSGSDRDSDW